MILLHATTELLYIPVKKLMKNVSIEISIVRSFI